ncbi:helix-turn-helix transcriptional regulator [Kocuria sp. JC486]|uniref:AraC family transcriptional regulator n=1 Tax=Kocuria soli TaxID=2485125 RepID=A0A3N3ZSC5_9MICC|nr:MULTISPECIES: AraC family transcriptional regulator [Kocuria]NHU85709.1 helix-turn-helix transcriptional regulator [Kocuria sp. JC486]ROZ64334.1 AraC family transcriptional regulator [Kocuria soli]
MPSYRPQVPGPLRQYISRWEGYDYTLPDQLIHHGLPSTNMTLIFQFDHPVDAGWDLAATTQMWVLVAGLHTRPALIPTHGSQHGIQVSLTPLGSRAFLEMPIGALSGEIVSGAQAGQCLRETHERMSDLDWPSRFRFLTEYFMGRLSHTIDAPASPELQRAWHLLTHGSSATVDQAARETGWSRRHLLNRFRSEYGLTPSELRRLARFQEARRLAESGLPLATVAHTAGYADQAHLTREWSGFADVPPKVSLAEFPNVQEPLPGQ